jgi:hypothetical protein
MEVTLNVDELRRAGDLQSKIAQTQTTLEAYRAANHIVVGLKRLDSHFGQLVSYQHQITLTIAEIGDPLVAALERRIAAMRNELRGLGVEP